VLQEKAFLNLRPKDEFFIDLTDYDEDLIWLSSNGEAVPSTVINWASNNPNPRGAVNGEVCLTMGHASSRSVFYDFKCADDTWVNTPWMNICMKN